MKKSVAVVCSLALSGVLVSGAVLARGVSEKKASIGSQSALDIALEDAGVRSAQASNAKSVFERAGDGYVYDVEFDCGMNEYDYIIDAKSGEILVRDIDSDDGTPTTTISQTKTPTVATATDADGSSAHISVGQAKEIALAHAQLSASEVRFTKAELDRENGVQVYEIEFLYDGVEYEYSISLTGETVQKETDSKEIHTPTPKQENTDGSSAYISVEQAKEIALGHAKLSASEVRFRKAVLERDDGVAEYEIEFIKDRTEYEYSIDARTGKILEHSIDRD